MSEETYDRYGNSEHFGGCPECGGDDGYLNAGSAHWFFCTRHGTRWCPGWNLFSSWREQTEAEQRAAFARIEDYRVVKPIRPDAEKLRQRARADPAFVAFMRKATG